MLDVYPAREEPVGPLAGVSGLTSRAPPPTTPAAGRSGGCVDAERAERALAPAAAARATCWSRSAPATSSSSPRRWWRTVGRSRGDAPGGVERDYPLARLTTVRAGGPADLFARPDERGGAGRAARAGRTAEGLAVGVVGSGSNLLVADDGFRGLVLKLDGELSAIEREGSRVVCGGGARLPSAAAKAARLGAGRARVRDQHPGHGRRRGADERQRLRRRARPGPRVGRRLHRRRGRAPRARTSSASPTGARTWGRARSSRAPRSGSREGDVAEIKAHPRRDARQAPRGAAVRDQDLRLDLQEPRRRARRGPHRRASCSRRRAAAGSRSAAPASRRSTRTSSRTPAGRRPPTSSR